MKHEVSRSQLGTYVLSNTGLRAASKLNILLLASKALLPRQTHLKHVAIHIFRFDPKPAVGVEYVCIMSENCFVSMDDECIDTNLDL